MRNVIPVLAFLIPATTTLAVPVVDQSHIITQSTGGRIVYAGDSPAQTFGRRGSRRGAAARSACALIEQSDSFVATEMYKHKAGRIAGSGHTLGAVERRLHNGNSQG
jgi:hypothetical protein